MIRKMLSAMVFLAVAVGLPASSAFGADDLPARALARIGSHRFYHGPGIECAVLSPDGSRAASVARLPDYFHHATEKEREAYESVVVLWDTATGGRIREMRAPSGRISRIAFSPDGNRLVAARHEEAANAILEFDVETGKLIRGFGQFESQPRRLEFSADGKQLRVSEEWNSVSLWDVVSGKEVRRWQPPKSIPPEQDKRGKMPMGGVLSPDGRFLVWLMSHYTVVDGQFNRILTSNGLVVYDAGTGKLLYEKRLDHPLAAFTFSPDGRRFAFAENGERLKVCDAGTGEEVVSIEIAVYGIAIASDGKRALIAEGDSRVRLWDLETKKPIHEIYPGFAYIAKDNLAAGQVFSADGKTVLLTTDTTLRLFDTKTGKERTVPAHRAPPSPRFSADGRTLFTSCSERKCSWDISNDRKPILLSEESRKSWEGVCGDQVLAHSDDELLFLDDRDKLVRLREAATGRTVREFEGCRGGFFGLLTHDASRALVWQSGKGKELGGIRLYDTRTGKLSGEIKEDDKIGYPLFSPDGTLIAWAAPDHCVHLYDAVAGKVLRTLKSSQPLPGTQCSHSHLLFSPDGEYLVVTTSFRDPFSTPDERDKWNVFPTRVFHVPSGKEISRFYHNPETTRGAGRIACSACSPDDRLLAVAEEESGTIRLIEIASGNVRVELKGHRDGVRGLAFSPDGKTLASGGNDNVVLLWDVPGSRTLARVEKASDTELAKWWADLAAEDGKRIDLAMASLIRTPGQSVAFLADRLSPAEAIDEKRLARLFADLDAEAFTTREAAARELAGLGERAEGALRRALKDGPTAEARRRIEALLDKLDRAVVPPETLRVLRAIEVLEHAGTAEAVRCLEALAKGAPPARETREAKAARKRLGNRR